MLSHTLLNDICDVLERGSQLVCLVVAECDVVGDVTLVARTIESLIELHTGILILLFLVQDATCGDDGFSCVRWHLTDE